MVSDVRCKQKFNSIKLSKKNSVKRVQFDVIMRNLS